MPTKRWTPACGSSPSGAIPSRAGISSSLSPVISPRIRLRNAPNCKRPTSPDGSCVAVSFIRIPQPDIGQRCLRNLGSGALVDRLGTRCEAALERRKRKTDRSLTRTLELIGLSHFGLDVSRDRLVKSRLDLRERVVDSVSLAFGKEWGAIEPD